MPYSCFRILSHLHTSVALFCVPYFLLTAPPFGTALMTWGAAGGDTDRGGESGVGVGAGRSAGSVWQVIKPPWTVEMTGGAAAGGRCEVVE